MTDDPAATSTVTAEMYRVGFNISSNRFVETMRICYEPSLLRTLYVRHALLPASVHFQKSVKRLHFSKAGYFNDFNMNQLYSNYNQQQQAAVALQDEQQHQHVRHIFDNNTLFLTRGHLAAKADYIYASQQRSTFNFFNAAPQWQGFNGGQWNALEDAVRKYAANSRQWLDCYTGTWGIMKLPGPPASPPTTNTTTAFGPQRDFYLARDGNNNGLLPVPMLYYRLLVNSQHSRGIVLVGVNNPHASLNEISSDYVICDDIQEKVGWLRWMSNTNNKSNKNLKKGYLYACHVGDFVKAVGHLPGYLLNVTEVLV
ncbi:uncharacterized protein LOC133329108 [Musca vetustissima]|uniref:uncharacterized protein LOC133329108 n=1 Tax=Musca vetustissima TaxID=27455 RepID=UPI002AB5E211|nr:uncharacterized protein LOC133329108 [Musca vetustissima]